MRFLEMGKGVVSNLFDDLVDGALDALCEEEKLLIDACGRRNSMEEQHMKRLVSFADSEVTRFKGTTFPEERKSKVFCEA